MKLLNCETCGAPLTISEDGLYAKCEVCGNVYEYRNPKEEFCIAQLNEANDLRQHMDFDDAIKKYRAILKTEKEDAEVWWGLLLSTYGVEYVKDPFTGRYIPTFHRNKRGNILEDEAALMTIQYATDNQKDTYFTQLKELRMIQEGIENIANRCEPYEVFISFKATDQEGRKTEDRDIAFNIYDELNSKGIKTFFSEVTLRGMASSDYEAVIFNALNTCKVFILVGTSKENINSTWVKNEWTRFRDTVREDIKLGVKAPSHFAVVGSDMSPSDLPEIFNKTQNVMLKNYAGDGYTKDIALSVCNILGISEKERELARKKAEEESKKALEKEREERERWQKEQEEKLKNMMQSQSVQGSAEAQTTMLNGNIKPLLKRIQLFLSDADFESAYEYAEKVLDLDPENSEAYFDKVLVDNKKTSIESLKKSTNNLASNRNFQRAMQFASKEQKSQYEELVKQINQNIEVELEKEKEKIYKQAFKSMNLGKKVGQSEYYEEALNEFNKILGYKKTNVFVKECKDEIQKIQDKQVAENAIKVKAAKEKRLVENRKNKKKTIIFYCLLLFPVLLVIIIPLAIDSSRNHVYLSLDLKGYEVTGVEEGITEVNIPSEYKGKPVVSIQYGAFRGNSDITKVTIPSSVKSIGEYAFEHCKSLTSVTIPDSITRIEDETFSGCKNLTSVTIPSSVTSIGHSAFSFCSSLESITIPSSVTSIGHSAFSFCSSLESITIPNTVTSIGGYAFWSCSSLKNITFKGSIAQWNAIKKHTEWKNGVPATVVHCTDGDVAL